MDPRVLGLGLFKDGDVGVGVFPEGEEILVGSLCLELISGQNASSRKAEEFINLAHGLRIGRLWSHTSS